jgi:hypothetical protein
MKLCSYCSKEVHPDALECPNCGHPQHLWETEDENFSKSSLNEGYSSKSPCKAFMLCFFLGVFGIHRFYVGKILSGFLMFLTFGGVGIWVLIDLISIARNRFKDAKGLGFSDKLIFKKLFIFLTILYGLILTAIFIIVSTILYWYSTDSYKYYELFGISKHLVVYQVVSAEEAYYRTYHKYTTSYHDLENFGLHRYWRQYYYDEIKVFGNCYNFKIEDFKSTFDYGSCRPSGQGLMIFYKN